MVKASRGSSSQVKTWSIAPRFMRKNGLFAVFMGGVLTSFSIPLANKPPGLHQSALHHRYEAAPVFEDRNIRQYVAIHDQHVGQLARLQGANLVTAAEDFGTRLRGAFDRFEGRKADILDEEGQLLRIVAMRVP